MVATASCADKRAHILARRCSSNLKQIAYACRLYSADWDEAFPPDMDTLVREGYLKDVGVFICRERSTSRGLKRSGGPASGGIPAQMQSYCYVSGLKATAPPHYVLAFDEEWNYEGEGINVLYVGGNVEWFADIAGFHADLKKQESDLTAQGRAMKVMRPSWSRYPDPPAGVEAPLRGVAPSTALKVLGVLGAVALVAFIALVIRSFAREDTSGGQGR